MSEIVLQINEGKIKGTVSTDYKGGTFHSFKGIPYAKPPIGELRFKPPQPPEPWEDIKDCTKEGSECLQKRGHKILGSEDCLFLNVYVPKRPDLDNSALPVMFYIHGGGFIIGSNKTDYYGAEYLMTGDIILVTINYRLGVYGFLSFDDPSIPVSGNNGLKDQIMALKWVQRNIYHFNGDPNKVTIFGESAGSGCCHLHVLSPMASGLFQKAILQSGAVLCPWTPAKRCARELGQAIGLENTNEKIIYKKLQSMTGEELLEAQANTYMGIETRHKRCYGYVVEHPSAEPAFLSKHPLKIMKKGEYNQVPMIIGYNDKEGFISQIWWQAAPGGFNISRFEDLEKLIPHHFEVEKGSNVSQSIAQKLQEYYFQGKTPTMDMIDGYHDMETDKAFLRGIYQSVKIHMKATPNIPIYFYRFSVDKALNYFKKLGKIDKPGASHCDDLGYLFKTSVNPDVELGSIEDQVVQRMVRLWSNFARTGNPNPIKPDTLIDVHWKPVKQDKINFLEIGEKLQSGTNPDKERMDFWDELTAMSPSAKDM